MSNFSLNLYKAHVNSNTILSPFTTIVPIVLLLLSLLLLSTHPLNPSLDQLLYNV